MCIDFLILQDAEHFAKHQVLPEIYNLEAYNGNSAIYIISADGYRFKVNLVKPHNGQWYLTGPNWTAFCNRNLNQAVHMLHFVEEGDDCFYVTGYLQNGYEVGGYDVNRATYSRFKTVVWPDPRLPQAIPAELLLEFHEFEELTMQVNRQHFFCHVRRAAVHGHIGTYNYQLLVQVWNSLVEAIGLQPGTTCVFTKNMGHNLWVDAFDDDGSIITQGVFKGAATLRKVQLPLDWHEQNDDRMKHICYWPSHTDHFGEYNRIFYKSNAQIQCRNRLAIPVNFLAKHPMHMYRKALLIHHNYREEMRVRMEPHRDNPFIFLAYVTDRGRLNIPHDFVKAHEMWKYHNAILRYSEEEEFYVDVDREFHSDRPNSNNHVKIKCRWSEIVKVCQWEPNKMVRFKLVQTVEDVQVSLPSRKPILIPVFHMC